MPFPKLRIQSDAIGSTHGAKIYLGDQEVGGIVALKLEGSVGDVWRLSLQLLPDALDIEIGGVVIVQAPRPPQLQPPAPPKDRTIADAAEER